MNNILATMSVDDLNRRYRGSFVRYKDSTVLISEFLGNRNLCYISGNQGRITEAFDPDALCTERPSPRWFVSDDIPFYVAYKFTRQWHRGFCNGNTNIMAWDGNNIRWHDVKLFAILDSLYTSKIETTKTTTDSIKERFEKGQAAIVLSPQICVTLVGVFYRERCIGHLETADKLFHKELNEVITDYEDYTKRIASNPELAAKKEPVKKAGTRNAAWWQEAAARYGAGIGADAAELIRQARLQQQEPPRFFNVDGEAQARPVVRPQARQPRIIARGQERNVGLQGGNADAAALADILNAVAHDDVDDREF